LAIFQKTPVNILKNIFEKNISPHSGEISPPTTPASPKKREKKKRGPGATKSAGLWKRLEGGGG